jgi:endonuclease G
MTQSRTQLQAQTGYDPGFLGVPVDLPAVPHPTIELDYVHFTVLLRPDRRLAALTAVNIDGGRLVQVPRDDDWRLDPRAPAEAQAGNELYRDNDLDRGHLVRRNDPVWGERETAEQANVDTFHYPNAAPQASGFNQSRELWLGLEDYLLEHADAHDLRLTVVTGPVLAAGDPVYRGVPIPLAFWKIAAWDTGSGLAATGYVLDQSPRLEDLARARAAGPDAPPPLGAFRTFQVPVADIGLLTGLAVDQLAAADVLAVTPTVQPRVGATAAAPRWRRLEAFEDLTVTRPVDLRGATGGVPSAAPNREGPAVSR